MRRAYRGGTCPHGVYLDTRCFNCVPDRDEVNLRVDLTVDPAEMRTWRPEVIYRYFAGIAMLLDAVRTGRNEAAAEKAARLYEGMG